MPETKALETIRETLAQLIDKLGVEYSSIEIEDEGAGMFRANIATERAPFLIGMYGERIDAIQHILKNILWKQGKAENIFVIVDVDNYKKSREDRIVALAEEKVEAARMTGNPQIMPPMDPYLRKIVHTHINAERFQDVTTQSVGEGRGRRLQIVASESSHSHVDFSVELV